MAEPRVGCGAAIIVEGRILLLKRATEPESGCWGLPGGKIDMFETARAATIREVSEELGITIAATDLLCVMDQIDETAGTHWVAPIYVCETFEGTPRNLEPGKHNGLGWFDLGDLPGALTTPTKAAVAAWNARG